MISYMVMYEFGASYHGIIWSHCFLRLWHWLTRWTKYVAPVSQLLLGTVMHKTPGKIYIPGSIKSNKLYICLEPWFLSMNCQLPQEAKTIDLHLATSLEKSSYLGNSLWFRGVTAISEFSSMGSWAPHGAVLPQPALAMEPCFYDRIIESTSKHHFGQNPIHLLSGIKPLSMTIVMIHKSISVDPWQSIWGQTICTCVHIFRLHVVNVRILYVHIWSYTYNYNYMCICIYIYYVCDCRLHLCLYIYI